MNQKGAVGFEHEEPDSLGKSSREAACVYDFAASDQQTHGADRTVPFGQSPDEQRNVTA